MTTMTNSASPANTKDTKAWKTFPGSLDLFDNKVYDLKPRMGKLVAIGKD